MKDRGEAEADAEAAGGRHFEADAPTALQDLHDRVAMGGGIVVFSGPQSSLERSIHGVVRRCLFVLLLMFSSTPPGIICS
mmetsp:Transcript_14032/g.18660  ORF Transcript_14032/g.18660 Transcript_14032/m.18660 type:complete len:80 (-) Transcript_14032:3-242(-)